MKTKAQKMAFIRALDALLRAHATMSFEEGRLHFKARMDMLHKKYRDKRSKVIDLAGATL
jgi:hypothetical protein